MKDAGTTPASPPSSETKPDGKPADPPKPRAPETYAEFKVDSALGELDKDQLNKATPIFRELDLDQAQAQKLVDFFTGFQKQQMEAVTKMRADWVSKVKSDSEMSGQLETIKTDIGRMYTHLPIDVANELKAAFDLTGAGDHPAIVKGLWKLAQKLNEGTHVTGGNPSKEGQKAPGAASRPSLASAMYPSLTQG